MLTRRSAESIIFSGRIIGAGVFMSAPVLAMGTYLKEYNLLDSLKELGLFTLLAISILLFTYLVEKRYINEA